MPIKKISLVSNQKEGEKLFPLEQNDPGMLPYVAVGLLFKDRIFPFGLHSNTETLAVLALTLLQYIQKYLSKSAKVTNSSLLVWSSGEQGTWEEKDPRAGERSDS